jgi:hypothetical protein
VRLDAEGRVEELGRMLGGETVSEGLRASAREMLANRHAAPSASKREKGEPKPKGESERAKAKGGRGA